MVNTLLKIELQVTVIQLASLLERNFCHALFSGNFQSNCSSKFLVVAGSERLDIKYFLSKTRKTSQNDKKLLARGLQNGCSEKVENVQEKCRNPASVTLTCPSRTFFRGVLKFFLGKAISQSNSNYTCKGCLFGEPNTCYFDRAPQGLLLKQKHSPKVILGRSCSEKFPNFHEIEPLMKSFLR